MSAIHLEWNPVGQQLESLRALVAELGSSQKLVAKWPFCWDFKDGIG